MEPTVTFNTTLYTAIGTFDSPFSYDETMKKTAEGNGVLVLTRHAIVNRTIRDEKTGERTEVDSNSIITVRLDTNLCPILCYEEAKMTDVQRTPEEPTE